MTSLPCPIAADTDADPEAFILKCDFYFSQNNPANLDGFTTLTMGIVVLILACLPRGSDGRKGSGTTTDSPPARYDPEALSAYFAKRPLAVVQRASEIVSKMVGFLLSIMVDAQTGQWHTKMPARAKELRKVIESMGATSIKVCRMVGHAEH